jgi:nucleotide-binding universal stress UspA family protein
LVRSRGAELGDDEDKTAAKAVVGPRDREGKVFSAGNSCMTSAVIRRTLQRSGRSIVPNHAADLTGPPQTGVRPPHIDLATHDVAPDSASRWLTSASTRMGRLDAPDSSGRAAMTTHGEITKILIPTDFSAGSERAWAMARQLARTLGAELTVMHVLPATPVEMLARDALEEARAAERALQAEHQLGIPRADDSEPLPALPTTFLGPFTGEGVTDFSVAGRAWAAKLDRWATNGAGSAGNVTTLLRVGSPAREIVAAAADQSANLIVMATHGRGEVHRLLVGSVADKVIRMAPCPVLIVK